MQQNGEKYFYLYNSSDMRIYKENQTESLQEFTLIDATGILGVKQMTTDRWELYAGRGKNAYKYTELGISTSSETYYIHDHLGNIRLSLSADMAGNHLQSALDYDPYGHLIRQYTATQPERYLTTGNERDQETQLDYRQARFYDSEIGRFLSVDPLGDRRIWLSPYNYVQNNPLLRVDPTGEFDEPIYDANGVYLGSTKEGFTGEVLIYSGTEKLDFSKMSAVDAKKMDNVDLYDSKRGSLSKNAKSNIWTDLASHFEGLMVYDVVFSMDKLVGKKIHFGGTGSWTSSWKLGKRKGKISGSDKFSYETTVENVASSIIVHEWYSHIMKDNRDAMKSHRLAYKNVINYKFFWNHTTAAYKGFNLRKLRTYTERETSRKMVDPIYRKMYYKYYKSY